VHSGQLTERERDSERESERGRERERSFGKFSTQDQRFVRLNVARAYSIHFY